jgi:acyl-CoA thioester hydrolase
MDLVTTDLVILPDWTDQNGHMNVAYFVLAFDRATDAFYDALGIGWDYLAREQRSLFTLAMNVDYVREVHAGSRVRIASRLLDHDAKRIHYFHEMVDAARGSLAATNEIVAMHVDMATRRSSAFAAATEARVAAMRAAHAALPRPALAGRALGIRRASTDGAPAPSPAAPLPPERQRMA